MPLYYEDVVVRNTGSSDLSGTTRVRDVVTVALVSIFLTASTNNAVVVTDNVQTSLSNWGIRSTFDSVVVRNVGSTDLAGVNKVREFVQVNMSASGPVNLSSARVDICLLSENVGRTLTPVRVSISDTVYIREAPGQDSPVIVRESVTPLMSGSQNIRLIFDNIGISESVTRLVYRQLLSKSVSDNVFVRENVAKYTSSIDTSYVRESVTVSLHNQLMSASINSPLAVTDSVAKQLTPIYPTLQFDSSIVTELVIGFLSARLPGTRVIVDPVGVSENVIRKHSHIKVLVFDTIGIKDGKARDTRGYWFKYSSRYRG